MFYSSLFVNACRQGNLLLVKVLSYIPFVDISTDNDFAFRMACAYGHLKLAQWLLQVKPDINISAHNEDAFCNACLVGHLEVAQWLADEVKPERYEITEVTSNARGKHKIQYKIYENNDRPMDYILK